MTDTLPIVEYKCSLFGHLFSLRTTERQPDPNRWEGYSCGYCKMAKSRRLSVLHRVGYDDESRLCLEPGTRDRVCGNPLGHADAHSFVPRTVRED